MNVEQARFLLQGYRPRPGEPVEPAIAEAVRLMETEPELRAWYERQRSFDAAAAAKLREVAPPPNLRATILAGGRVGQRAGWRRAVPWAIAASIALLLAAGGWGWRHTAPQFAATLPDFALRFAGRGYIGLEQRGGDLEGLLRWLETRQAPLPAQVPPELAALRRLGCRTVEFRGREVSVICFDREREFHLFVARRADFPELETGAEPRFSARGNWAAASWSDQTHHYVVVSDAGAAAIGRLL